jgi:hypothetical protein
LNWTAELPASALGCLPTGGIRRLELVSPTEGALLFTVVEAAKDCF